MYEQLSLDLSSSPKTESLNKMSVEHFLGIKTQEVFNYEPSQSVFRRMSKLAEFIYQHKKWKMADLQAAAFHLVSYYDFPNGNQNLDKVESVAWKGSPMEKFPHDQKELLFQLQYHQPTAYHCYFVVKDNDELKTHGGIRKFNNEGCKDKTRFVVQNTSELIGYSQIVDSVNDYYLSRKQSLGFSQKTLNLQLKKVIDANYNYEAVNHQSTPSGLFDPWISDTTKKKSKRIEETRIHTFLNDYLCFIHNLTLQNNRSSQLMKATAKRPTTIMKVKVAPQLSKFFAKVISTELIDLDLFERFQQALLCYLPKLPQGKEKPTLELANLRKQNIFGLYLPKQNKIVIDFPQGHQLAAFGEAGCRSFLHAYGIYLDYQFSDELLSFQKAFINILSYYQTAIGKRDLKYQSSKYQAPSEVFATAFEVFSVTHGMDSLLTKKSADFTYKDEYEVFDNKLNKLVDSYFEQVFPSFVTELPSKQKAIVD